MIANLVELRVAVRQLRILEKVFRSHRETLEASNPWLFKVTSKAYLRRIASLQAEIVEYLAAHPADVSLILPAVEQATAVISNDLARTM